VDCGNGISVLYDTIASAQHYFNERNIIRYFHVVAVLMALSTRKTMPLSNARRLGYAQRGSLANMEEAPVGEYRLQIGSGFVPAGQRHCRVSAD
jgi:hypothetical protein